MRKILNSLGLIALIGSCIGIGYIFNLQNEVQNQVQTTEIPIQGIPFDVSGVRAVSNIQYGQDKRQALDIFLPPGEGKFPVLFFVHGGAWSNGDREAYGSVGYFYAKNGYVTVLVDHRLSPAVAHPAHIEDVAQAFVWTRNNINNFNGDSNPIYIAGHSSGAHLVSLLATNQKYLNNAGGQISEIKKVVTISGIYSLGTNISIAGLGHVFPTTESRKDASPVNFINRNAPPFLIIYAEKDLVTLETQAINFHKNLRKTNIPASLHRIKKEDHTTVLIDCVMPQKSSRLLLEFMR